MHDGTWSPPEGVKTAVVGGSVVRVSRRGEIISAPWMRRLDPADPGWPGSLPGAGFGHWVYFLNAAIPGEPDDGATQSVYVGVTSNLRARLLQHSRKWWWSAICPDLCYFDSYVQRSDAEEAEKEAIREYQPAMNRAGRLLVVTEP